MAGNTTGLYLIIGIAFLLLVIAVILAIYMVLQKKEKASEDDKRKSSIYASGIYSISMQSSRKALLENPMTREQMEELLKSKEQKDFKVEQVEQYFNHWNKSLEKNIATIEEGDLSGVKTYCYIIPEKEKELCSHLTEGTYVTREQLQNYPQIIPPFYPGCDVMIAVKQANDTTSAWNPLLPVNGSYVTPEKGNVVAL